MGTESRGCVSQSAEGCDGLCPALTPAGAANRRAAIDAAADGDHRAKNGNGETRFIDCGRQLLVYRRYLDDESGHRTWALIALNFSSRGHWLELQFPEDGTWTNLLADPEWTIEVRDRQYRLEIPSHWGLILHQA